MAHQSNTSNNTANNCTVSYLFPLFISYIVISFTSAVGNFLVILIVYRNRLLRTTPNYFIASMSASDMFYPIASLITFTISRYGDLNILSDKQNYVLSVLANLFADLSFGVSMQSLVAICVHRFYAVVYPLKARLENPKLCTLTICLNWLSATALYAFKTYSSVGKNCETGMSYMYNQWLLFDVIDSCLVVVPFLVMLVLYPIILRNLRGRKLPGVTNSSSLQATRRKKQNVRLSLMFITLVVIFFATWGILWGIALIYEYSPHTSAVSKVVPFALLLPGIYTSINPLIYFSYSTNYRNGLKEIFSCCNLTSVTKIKRKKETHEIEL